MLDNHLCYSLKNFEAKTLVVESQSLKNNPLGDSQIKFNPIITPKVLGAYPVIIVLAGFTGTGQKYVNYRSFEKNMAQVVDDLVTANKAPFAHYVFVDAMTYWGGSQFVNSKGCGNYEDYIVNDLVHEIRDKLEVVNGPWAWTLMGGSSGGYGALHLGSKYPELFGHIGAIAPDSDFTKSLLPEILTALPHFEKIGGISGIRRELLEGKFFRRKVAHNVINAVAMNLCYSGNEESQIEWPIDNFTGEIIESRWRTWLAFDPIHFLSERIQNVKKLQSIYLDVGKFDQFQLQYGTRKISRLLEEHQVDHNFKEFDGSHFDISERRPQFLEYLTKIYS